jgi:hypothetical protein
MVARSASGLGDHHFAGVDPDQAAGRTDALDHGDEVVSRPAADIQDGSAAR